MFNLLGILKTSFLRKTEGSGGNMLLSSKFLKIEWLGQTLASTLWIISVFSYGIYTVGDYLQLSAASAWLLANLSNLGKD